MKVSDFFAHHGVIRNPFSEEDAQSDQVFQSRCLDQAHHPCWDKIYGDPALPSTSIVFGEKGAGKTALRIQMNHALDLYNKSHPKEKEFVINYDDFNPFLDSFQQHFHGSWKKPERFIKYWKLWDHIDAILSLGVTKLIDQILLPRKSHTGAPSSTTEQSDTNQENPQQSEFSPASTDDVDLRNLTGGQRRDLLLLAALYDHSTSSSNYSRWIALRRKLGQYELSIWKWTSFGIMWFILFFALALITWRLELHNGAVFARVEAWLFFFAGMIPLVWQRLSARRMAKKIWKKLRSQKIDREQLTKILLQFTPSQLANQPIPVKDSSDDRYTLLGKFKDILNQLNYKGVIVLVDRVDEPFLINGSAPLMRDFIWPLLDNKLLKYNGIGFKLLLPEELYDFAQRETPEFHQRSRLDKQNVISSLHWTGQSLYDMANARLAACSDTDFTQKPAETIDQLFSPDLDMDHLLGSLQTLSVPRKLFKFLHSVIVTHTNSHTSQNPSWTISRETFNALLNEFQRK